MIETRETHISRVFLTGDRAYKLKKPLKLDFLDYSTPELRHAACAEEVRLNRRLAPEIYLGVRGVVRDGRRCELCDEDDPRAADFVVEMRRFDEANSLAGRAARDELTDAQIVTVGRWLTAYHADAPRVRGGDPERVFEQNIHELLALEDDGTERRRLLALGRFAQAFWSAHAALRFERAAAGWWRELHGDLRCEHVLVDDGEGAGRTQVRAVDCIEFDPALRRLDVADELAFLCMDLAAQGQTHRAGVLIDAYRAAGGDPGPDVLVAFYAAYRALVRAKVALHRSRQHDTDGDGDRAVAAGLIELAERFTWRARGPLVVVVCGVPASGKSTLAAALAERAGWPVIAADITRKHLLGIPVDTRAPRSAYAPDLNRRTYQELAVAACDAGRGPDGGAIVDATFRHSADRAVFEEAVDADLPVLYVECQAPVAELTRRAVQRDRARGASDADREIVEREHGSWESLDEIRAASHIILRADRPAAELAAEVAAIVDGRLAEILGAP